LIRRPSAPIPFEHQLGYIITGSKRSAGVREWQKSIRSASGIHLAKTACAKFCEIFIVADAETMLEADCRCEWRTRQIELGDATCLPERHVQSVGCTRR